MQSAMLFCIYIALMCILFQLYNIAEALSP